MNILGKELSEKTAAIINEITAHLSKPVEYRFTDPNKTNSYGQCDPWQPDAYYIYCKKSLLSVVRKNQINIAFETNILHELYHLCQIEEGFPHTCTRSTPVTTSHQSYYDNLGSLIASTVLDLNVDFRLKQNGYTSSYFYSQRIMRAEKVIQKGYTYEGNDFLCAALMFMGLKLSANPTSVNKMLQLHLPQNRNLVVCCISLADAISQIGYNNAESAFKSLSCLFGTFNLFATHSIIFHGKEYIDFASAKQDYPDTHIVLPPTSVYGG